MFHGISAIISGFWGLGIRLTTDHLESTGNFHSQTATADIIDASVEWFVKAKKLQRWINMVHCTTPTFCYDSLLNDSFFVSSPDISPKQVGKSLHCPGPGFQQWFKHPWFLRHPGTKNSWPFQVKGKWWFTIANLRYPAKKKYLLVS